ncbi:MULTISPECIES: hypothetical protein [unclassified Saccharicrinis]|uniref:hypothetical protein n=1 Tax=unclassified Saccharicrinis TaxID=2646859 RepID=UPI003D32D19C
MRLFKGFIVASVMLGVLNSCSPVKKLDASKVAAMATYDSQNYSQAYNQLSALISNYNMANIKVPHDIYLKAADCASRLKNFDGAAGYFSQALNDSVTLKGVKGYIGSIKGLGDNRMLSSVLSKYSGFLNENGEGDYLTKAQFDIALNEKDNNAILSTFPKLKNTNEEQSMAYLSALEEAGNKKEALDFCSKLVNENPSYNQAKEWKAVYYYTMAEEGYQSEMAKYNQNKTYTAYVYLKRDLKKVSANYRVSKGLFEDLRKQYPSEKKYVKYLKNIYLRLEMKPEAAAMEKLLQ